MPSIHQILKEYWGYDSFRPLQEDIIQSVLDGKDTLALLPTGGGKSICFQVPALAREGVCLVISPLIALMKDQVQQLVKRHIPATAVVSGMHRNEIETAFGNCIYGKTKFLYLSPERLLNATARNMIQKMNVNLIAVDEAHCISQWGYDFRPPYLKIAEIKEMLPGVPLLALTATATPEVVNDIQEKLLFKEKNALKKSFERSNLSYVVLDEEDKSGRLLKIANKLKGTGIVYVRSRKKTRQIAEHLTKKGIAAGYYHAGLDSQLRDRIQNDWINNRIRIIVATNAFGMGIDKPDVRFVVHMDLPDSLEAYFQEAGRAGRDEKKSYAILFYSQADKLAPEKNVRLSFPHPDEIKKVYQALANYFQLAVGAGKGAGFDFDISDFSNRYNFKAINVYHCLKFLEKDGYLVKSDSFNMPSRIHIRVNKDELYRFRTVHSHFDNFIKLILRSYSQVFDDFVKISESDLARRAEITIEEAAKILQKLDDFEMISYLPQKDKPQITFISERIDTDNLRLSKENYRERKEAAIKRMETVIHYASSENNCRSQALLSYFGESDTSPCGICDVCLEYKRNNVNNLEYERISKHVQKVIALSPLTLDEVVGSVKNSREGRTLKVIQWLIDNEKLEYDKANKLHWVK